MFLLHELFFFQSSALYGFFSFVEPMVNVAYQRRAMKRRENMYIVCSQPGKPHIDQKAKTVNDIMRIKTSASAE